MTAEGRTATVESASSAAGERVAFAFMTVVELTWRRFTETFGEAIALHWEHGDRDTIIKLIRRARELLDDYRDELPRGRTLAEQVLPRAVETSANQLEQMEIELGVARH